jgi:hypothetical protein
VSASAARKRTLFTSASHVAKLVRAAACGRRKLKPSKIMDLEAMFRQICKDGGGVSKMAAISGQPPIMFESPEAEAHFKKQILGDADLNEPLPTRTCSEGEAC